MYFTLRHYFYLVFVLLLAACTGSGVTGPADGGAVGGGSQNGGSNGDLTATLPVGNPPSAQASGDGTLGSQSANVDLTPQFYREYSLFFSGETPGIGSAEYGYFLPKNPGKLPDAQVLKIFKTPVYKEVPCLACVGKYVRAVNCGSYSDEDILEMIPEEEKKSNPTASSPLLWFLLHMPRLEGNSAFNTCEGASYRDFPVTAYGVVDLDALEVQAQDIIVFYLLPANPPAEVGPLSTNGMMQIPKEAIAATAKQGMLRFVRPHPPLLIKPELLQVITTN